VKSTLSTWTRRSVTRIAATAVALTLAITALVVAPASPAMASWCGDEKYIQGHDVAAGMSVRFTNCPNDGGDSWTQVYHNVGGGWKRAVAQIWFYNTGYAEHYNRNFNTNVSDNYTWWGRGDIKQVRLCAQAWNQTWGTLMIMDCSSWVYM